MEILSISRYRQLSSPGREAYLRYLQLAELELDDPVKAWMLQALEAESEDRLLALLIRSLSAHIDDRQVREQLASLGSTVKTDSLSGQSLTALWIAAMDDEMAEVKQWAGNQLRARHRVRPGRKRGLARFLGAIVGSEAHTPYLKWHGLLALARLGTPAALSHLLAFARTLVQAPPAPDEAAADRMGLLAEKTAYSLGLAAGTLAAQGRHTEALQLLSRFQALISPQDPAVGSLQWASRKLEAAGRKSPDRSWLSALISRMAQGFSPSVGHRKLAATAVSMGLVAAIFIWQYPDPGLFQQKAEQAPPARKARLAVSDESVPAASPPASTPRPETARSARSQRETPYVTLDPGSLADGKGPDSPVWGMPQGEQMIRLSLRVQPRAAMKAGQNAEQVFQARRKPSPPGYTIAFEPPRPDASLRSGDYFRVQIHPRAPAFVHLLRKNSQGRIQALFAGPIPADQTHQLPQTPPGFQLDGPPGMETLYLIASARAIPDLVETVCSLSKLEADELKQLFPRATVKAFRFEHQGAEAGKTP